MEDLETAKQILGLGEGATQELDELRDRWLEMAAHEKVPGKQALIEIGPELLMAKPAGVRRMRRLLSR
jgi:hypothetical protein